MIALCLAIWRDYSRTTAPGRLPTAGGGASIVSSHDARAATPPTLPPVYTGTGQKALSGEVVDGAGVGVMGAAVVAERDGTNAQPSATGLVLTPAIVAHTDGDGQFQLQGLELAQYRLRVEHGDVFTSEVRFVDVSTRALRIVVTRKVAVAGQVVGGGAPVEGALVRLARIGAENSVEVQTDARGRFAFDALSEGRYVVAAGAADRAAQAVRVDRRGAGPFEDVVLALVPGAIVSGTVVDQKTKQGIADAAVVLASESSDWQPPRTSQCDGNGRFRIEGVSNGRYSVQASAPGYVAVEAISFAAGGYAPVIELARGGVVHGIAVTPTDAPIAGAQVWADCRARDGQRDRFPPQPAPPTVASDNPSQFLAVGELGVMLGPIPFPPRKGAHTVRVAQRVSASPVSSGATSPAASVTDSDGRFRVAGLPKARCHVVIKHARFAQATTPAVEVSLGAVVDVGRVALSVGVRVGGRVSAQSGRAIAGATVVAARSPDDADELTAVTDADGRYELGPFGVGPTLRVSAPGFVEVSRRLPGVLSGGPLRIENFTLPASNASLQGRVTDENRFDLVGALVRVTSRNARGSRRASTDAKGLFELGGLAPGDYDVVVEHAGFPVHRVRLSTRKQATIVMALGGGIDVLVRDAQTMLVLDGVTVAAKGPGGRARSARTDAGGIAELAPLAKGRWKLSVDHAGYARWMDSVEVPAGVRPGEVTVKNLTIEVVRGATVGGTVVDDRGSPVRGARVRATGRTASTDETGRFRLLGVAPGTVTVHATRGDRKGSQSFTFASGEVVTSLQLTIE